MIEFTVDADSAGMRLDKFLRKKLKRVPLSHLFKMIRTKRIRVNTRRAYPEQALQAGDAIAVRGTEERLLSPPPASNRPGIVDVSRLKVLIEDGWMMAVDKPSGLAVHPGSGISGATLVDQVRAYLGVHAVRNDFVASPAHRLDRDTSGVVLIAKRRPAMVRFTELFTCGQVKKRYLALVKGKMPRSRGIIDIALSEHQQTAASRAEHGVKMQEAFTHYRVISQSKEASLLECVTETGRTHQIRRHLSAVGHPIAGDRRYGDFSFNREAKARWGLRRLFLHAQEIEFPHPEHGGKVRISAHLPGELQEIMKRAGLNSDA
jgi:23S rRNA pseudouridine955/2504/2580 synthase